MNRALSTRFVTLFLLLLIMSTVRPTRSQTSETPLDRLTSSKELGCTLRNGRTTFRLFAPRAVTVTIVLYARHDDAQGVEHRMKRDSSGVWEYSTDSSLTGGYYGYRVAGPPGPNEMFDPSIVIADPYSRAVCTRNTYHHEAKTLIFDDSFDWGDDAFVIPENHNKLVIYEAHLRDLTAHSSSGVSAKGTYLGMTERGKRGGLSYLKELGVNAIEFLPLQKFGTIELPYNDSLHRSNLGEVNTWNPYERNHWGYMTSYFFAPETYYGSDGTLERGTYNGVDARAVREMKEMVRALHREGIAVLMDVVYNHVSQYDYNPFKYIDKFYYFRTDSAGAFLRTSGCGNDFYTERPMARRLIIESVLYWMKEYHIDGFRFDLATMIDPETRAAIRDAAQKVNPNVILIAEPWGGGKYDPAGCSDLGWAAWNDRIRNGAKGQNPNDGLGFIFGKFQGNNTKSSIQSYVTGTLRADGGLFVRKEHSINYLESHDDNTMGDFIRLATGSVREHDVVADLDKNAALTPRQLALNKLGALFLFSAQGPIMIHEGQEYARSKVIAPTTAPDPNVGQIDHNSYDKDNETNYLDYRQQAQNAGLTDYYKGLIRLRKKYPFLADAAPDSISFLPTKSAVAIAFTVKDRTPNGAVLLVVLNGDASHAERLKLPRGQWAVIVDGQKISATDAGKRVSSASVSVPPTSGMILIRR